MTSWVVYGALFSYVKVSVFGLCRQKSTAALFWCGAVTQLGSAIGALIMFLLVNVASGLFVQYYVQCWFDELDPEIKLTKDIYLWMIYFKMSCKIVMVVKLFVIQIKIEYSPHSSYVYMLLYFYFYRKCCVVWDVFYDQTRRPSNNFVLPWDNAWKNQTNKSPEHSGTITSCDCLH